MSPARKLLFCAIMWLATGLAILAGIELVLPRFAPALDVSNRTEALRVLMLDDEDAAC